MNSPKKVRCPAFADRTYLTPGKVYETHDTSDNYDGVFHIWDDEGDELYCIVRGCAHLDGGNWEIVE